MAQKYPFANFQIDGKVVTLIMVAESGISTNELAQRSMMAFQRKLGRQDLVLVAKGMSLTPTYIGQKSFVDKMRDMPLGQVNWQHIEL